MKPVGISDVARAAGVSITTVSHALNNRGQVSARTRDLVRQVAADLGYAPNRIASALRSQRSNILGFVSDDIATTPFAGRVVLGAQDAAAEADQLLVVVNSNHDPVIEAKQIQALLAQQVDAVIFARMFHRKSDVPKLLANSVVTLVDMIDPRSEIPSVVPDEQQMARLATETLMAAGHHSIAHLTIDERGPGQEGRIEGFLDAIADAGAESVVIETEHPADTAAGRRAMQTMLSRSGPRPSAVFCFNDQMAMGVYQVALAAGISIPGQLSIVSIDDFVPIADGLMPGLTTVALPHYEMGRWATLTALAQLAGTFDPDAPRRTRLPGELVERGSIAAPAVR